MQFSPYCYEIFYSYITNGTENGHNKNGYVLHRKVELTMFKIQRFIKRLFCLLEPVSRVLGKFVFTFEVDATPVSMALFFPPVPGRKGFLSLNGCAVLALFAFKTGKVRLFS